MGEGRKEGWTEGEKRGRGRGVRDAGYSDVSTLRPQTPADLELAVAVVPIQHIQERAAQLLTIGWRDVCRLVTNTAVRPMGLLNDLPFRSPH